MLSKAALRSQLSCSAPPLFNDFHAALTATAPDVVCISTYPDTHEEYAVASLQAGAHVFLEKPLAPTVEAAQRVVAAAAAAKRQLLVVSDPLPSHPTH